MGSATLPATCSDRVYLQNKRRRPWRASRHLENICLDANHVVESVETGEIEAVNLKPIFKDSSFEEIMPRGQAVKDGGNKFISRGDGSFRPVSTAEWMSLKDSFDLLPLLDLPVAAEVRDLEK